jgi:uncharacterized membrane protein YeaQ/YmgE (transglycosylase-associated protein family)
MFLIIGFVGALIAAVVASSKNRNPLGYGALALLVPLIGVVVICSMSSLPAGEEASALEQERW